MADYHKFIDTLKIEKANAIARYQRFRNLAKLLQFLQLVLLLAFLSWSSTRIPDAVKTFKISGKYVAKFSTYVSNPHVIFLIGNAIVLALYVLSRHIHEENSSTTSVSYDDYENTKTKLSIAITAEVEAPVEMIEEDKQIEAPAVETIEEDKQIVCKESSNVIDEKESQVVEKAPLIRIKNLNRTMSEKLQQAKPRKEFRRSETQVRRVVVENGHQRMSRNLSKFETVDTLSNEDFRLTVEAFIEKQQNFLRQQRKAELIV
ncbi:uncharacterized protein LOC141685396 [Apium graveolens]|uniref:uncharacterized protein LOC141685396 n=1 Tax=Apium graveolens TaxID=4045 RepID=UPI003D7A3459